MNLAAGLLTDDFNVNKEIRTDQTHTQKRVARSKTEMTQVRYKNMPIYADKVRQNVLQQVQCQPGTIEHLRN